MTANKDRAIRIFQEIEQIRLEINILERALPKFTLKLSTKEFREYVQETQTIMSHYHPTKEKKL